MLVLILIYTFQFQQFPEYYKQLTNFTDQEWAIVVELKTNLMYLKQ